MIQKRTMFTCILGINLGLTMQMIGDSISQTKNILIQIVMVSIGPQRLTNDANDFCVNHQSKN